MEPLRHGVYRIVSRGHRPAVTAHTFVIETASPEETERLGCALTLIMPRGVIALRGDLASGKTCFVRGMAGGLGASTMVHSPTFTLINEYGQDRKLFHFDLYRLNGPFEVEDLGAAELFASDALCAVEWADRAEAMLPRQRLDVSFEHMGEDRRRVAFTDCGVLDEGWPERLRESSRLK